jgi:hypothetical protein
MTTLPVSEKNTHQIMAWLYAIEEECLGEEDDQKKHLLFCLA